MNYTFFTLNHFPENDPICQQVIESLFHGISHIIGQDGQEAKNQCSTLLMDTIRFNNYKLLLNRRQQRNLKHALSKGYVCERFNYSNFIPDVVEIKTSKQFRSGGELKEHYKRTVEQSGGYPSRFSPIEPDHCPIHQRNIFHGVFKEIEGYKQGNVVTNKKLVAFNGIAVCGELAIYSWNIGHGDFLNDGVMTLLTASTVKYLLDEHREVRYFVQGNWTDGLHVGPGLQNHKKELLFQPVYLIKA